AFARVARSEDAVARLSHIGPERVAAWFGALSAGVCPPPPVDLSHFVTVLRHDESGVQLNYRAMQKTCTIELNPDGTLASAHSGAASGPNASTPTWKVDAARN